LVSLEEVEALNRVTSLIIIPRDIGSLYGGAYPKSADARYDVTAIKQSGVVYFVLSSADSLVNCISNDISTLGFQVSNVSSTVLVC